MKNFALVNCVVSEKRLMPMCSFGTDEYIVRVAQTYSSMLLKAAYTILRSTADAEDAVQETFLKLITKRPEFSDREHEKAWLLRVVINTSRNMIKASAKKDRPLDESAFYTQDEASDILGAVLSLDPKYSTIVHLYYYEGYSIKEIADILKRPSATVGTRLARARMMLKSILEGELEQ